MFYYLRSSTMTMELLRIRFHQVRSVVSQFDVETTTGLPLECAIEAKLILVMGTRTAFLRLSVAYTLYTIIAAFINKYEWIEQMIFEIFHGLFFLAMLVLYRLRDVSQIAQTRIRQPESASTSEDMESWVLPVVFPGDEAVGALAVRSDRAATFESVSEWLRIVYQNDQHATASVVRGANGAT